MKNPYIKFYIKIWHKLTFSIVFIVLFFFPKYLLCQTDNIAAIIVSGYEGKMFEGTINRVKNTLMDSNTGPGLQEGNIFTYENASRSDIESIINNQINTNPTIDTVYFHLSSHGLKDGVILANEVVSAETLASVLEQINASTLNIIYDFCYSGSHEDELKSKIDPEIFLTSTDPNAKGLGVVFSILGYDYDGYYYYSKELMDNILDISSDTDSDGKVSLIEAHDKVILDGDEYANAGNPQNLSGPLTSIPTLSEWKQIFLTLLMLSLVMGFIGSKPSNLALSFGHGIINGMHVKLLTFKRTLYFKIMQRLYLVVFLGLVSARIVFGHVTMVDIMGIIFCTPLVAYILHLMIIFYQDNERILH